MKLLTGAPGWRVEADAIVIGTGVAGLTVALNLRAANKKVLVVTKAKLDEGSTKWAQGGIAAALGPGDTPAEHKKDTLIAGAGLCDEDAVEVLVNEGPAAIEKLIARGAIFDKSDNGEMSLTREGGHKRNRIIHAGGDATGAEVSRALLAALKEDPGIQIFEHAIALDLLKNSDGSAAGVTLHVIGEGSRDGVGVALAPAVVIATGGIGQVYSQSTNPPVSTGDGVALALRAGAIIADIEFIQFHPTVLWRDNNSYGQQPLISEAVRGEGAILRNDRGEAFMADKHPLKDLAPRDIVAKEIVKEMARRNISHVWLDATAIPEFPKRFPTIYQSCLDNGIDPTNQLIPVAPASHYASGGIRTNLDGMSNIPGLYACGESACTGAHGANRLASNSLLEGLVYGARIAENIVSSNQGEYKKLSQAEVNDQLLNEKNNILLDASSKITLQLAMTDGAGVVRSKSSLLEAKRTIDSLINQKSDKPKVENWEATNLYLLAKAIINSALEREESRGSHWREDFPETRDEFLFHITEELKNGEIINGTEPLK
jgi:L-aspartate oxidase